MFSAGNFVDFMTSFEKNVRGVEKFLEISFNVFGVTFPEISSIFIYGL